MLVLLSLVVVPPGRVVADLHLVSDDTRRMLDYLPCSRSAAEAVHTVTLRRIRPLADTLSALREVQRRLEASAAHDVRRLGHRRGLARLASPLLYMDASSLYAARVGGMFGGLGAWFPLDTACACGHNEWGLSCTPPRWTRDGRLVRDSLDACVGFCWTCLHRRDVDTTDACLGYCRVGLDFTHSAPQ